MLHYLINCATDRSSRLDAEAASLLPRPALDPANFAEQVAIAPPFGVNVDGKNSFQGAVQDELKIKRLHGDYNRRLSAGRHAGRAMTPAV